MGDIIFDTRFENPIAEFIAKWSASGGAERSNCQPFLIELCKLLDVPTPDAALEENRLNDYVFERSVPQVFDDGHSTTRFIDLYKRGCFVLEAKQSAARRVAKVDPNQLDLLGGSEAGQTKSGTAKRGTMGWDSSMLAALNQARDYAQLLPPEHGWPPFLVIVDVGHVIELWADFSGQGKRYTQFPDRQSYRISIDDLHDEEVRERLRAVWQEPMSLDPAKKSAEVTRDIAERLAKVARMLEAQAYDPKSVAEFLMRCLFTMFAEDVELLPRGCFTELLEKKKADPRTFPFALEHVWQAMNKGDYAGPLDAMVRRFNGWLFKNATALQLPAEAIHELWVASKRDWQDVEPAIFGTLLERALDRRERHQLGAHYTPRAYVERLVGPTIMDPLLAEWDDIQADARQSAADGRSEDAIKGVAGFHSRLCQIKVLDPACGTGNFLYVAMEMMKRLEGEVLDTLAELGDTQPHLTMAGHTVHPTQFLGLELNARAVEIAHLVVWIGFLKWQIKTNGLTQISEPILETTEHIFHRDAVLAYDSRELLRDEQGALQTRWDGVTMKLHPITGEEVPDEDARVELYQYRNPRRPVWPEADFIIGNPPFIGGKDLRSELGDGYAEALWKAHPHMPKSADFVTYWWDRAAELLGRKKTRLRRFGFITTNSITQTFSRRVLERHLNAKAPVHLVYAVPDHPWLKSSDKAAVRIAMTVAEAGPDEGVLATVTSEMGLNTDTPIVTLATRKGAVRGNLTVGADLSRVEPLLSNAALSSPGVKLHGAGFIVTPAQARHLGLGSVPGLEEYIRPYRNGRDMAQRPRGVMVIDLYPLTAEQVRDRFPAVYQWVLERVKPERDHNNMEFRRKKWWWFGATHEMYRSFIKDIPFYICTVETTKHRTFQKLPADWRADNMLVNFGLSDGAYFSILSSRLHVTWALAVGGRLGVGNDPRYNKSRCFDPFPFPDISELPLRLASRLRTLGDQLSAHRTSVQAQLPDLTMTSLYNVLERVRGLEWGTETEPLTDKERDINQRGLVGILKELHDDIDRATFEAYNWRDIGERLIGRPGATMPLDVKPEGLERAEEELLSRLVRLNAERADEERHGQVRWLRPEYQRPKFAHKVQTPMGDQQEADLEQPLAASGLPSWPKQQLDQIRAVRHVLLRHQRPASPEELSKDFKGGRNRARQIDRVLETLVAIGQASRDDDGRLFITR